MIQQGNKTERSTIYWKHTIGMWIIDHWRFDVGRWYGHSLMVRRSFLQKEDRRSQARLICPVLSLSSKRSKEGSDLAVTSPTGRRATTVPGPSETAKLSTHTGPADRSSLKDRTRARVVLDCRAEAEHGSTARLHRHRPARRGRPDMYIHLDANSV